MSDNELKLNFRDRKDPARLACEEEGRFPTLVPVDLFHHITSPDAPMSAIIEGDNYLALSILTATHAGKIDAIFIDPPYNTGTTESYENAFPHSDWLAAISARLKLARKLLSPDGIICITIDHVELGNLIVLADTIFGEENRLGIISVVHNEAGRSGFDYEGFNEVNEYYLFYGRGIEESPICADEVDGDIVLKRFNQEDENGLFYWKPFMRTGGQSRSEEFPNQNYPIYGDPSSGRLSLVPFGDAVEMTPIDSNGVGRIWNRIPASFAQMLSNGDLQIARSPSHPSGYTVQYKVRTKGGDGKRHFQQPRTVWTGKDLNAVEYGTKLLKRMIGDNPFSYPKSMFAVKRALHAMVGNKKNAIILDFYAGSGTTAHATLLLNDDDNGSRKFILITNNDLVVAKGKPSKHICEEICLPRVKAAIDGYDDEVGLPANVRYFRIEMHDHVGDPDDLFLKLVKSDSGIIQLQEGVSSIIEEDDEIGVFSRLDGSTVGVLKVTSAYDRMIGTLANLPGPRTLYLPSIDHRTNFSKPPFEVDIKVHPEKIMTAFRSLWWRSDLSVRKT